MVAGGVVFVLAGFTPMRRITQQRQWIREATSTVGMLGLFVFAVLAVTSSTLLFPTISIDDARPVIDVWAGDDYDVVSVAVDTDAVDVVVAGPTEPATPTSWRTRWQLTCNGRSTSRCSGHRGPRSRHAELHQTDFVAHLPVSGAVASGRLRTTD